MDEKFIEDFMKIGIDTFEDAEAIFELSSKYFLDIKEAEYKSENSTLAEGLLNKMVSIGGHFELDETLLEEIVVASNNFVSVFGNPNHSEANKLPHFNKALSVSMKFYTAMVKFKPKRNSDVGPFRPSNCDKSNIVARITEAVELINSTELINQKTKDRLVDSLNKVILELNKSSTNWDIYFRKINHTILLLGALSTIATNIIGVTQIKETKQKLEEANYHLQKTAITINNNDIKEVFVVNEHFNIEASNVLRLNEKKPMPID